LHPSSSLVFLLRPPPPPHTFPLSLHDALPILPRRISQGRGLSRGRFGLSDAQLFGQSRTLSGSDSCSASRAPLAQFDLAAPAALFCPHPDFHRVSRAAGPGQPVEEIVQCTEPPFARLKCARASARSSRFALRHDSSKLLSRLLSRMQFLPSFRKPSKAGPAYSDLLNERLRTILDNYTLSKASARAAGFSTCGTWPVGTDATLLMWSPSIRRACAAGEKILSCSHTMYAFSILPNDRSVVGTDTKNGCVAWRTR